MSQGNKPFAYITQATLVAVIDAYPLTEHADGKFMLEGRVVIYPNDLFKPGDPIRTSQLVNVDIEKGWFETMNTVYVVIATSNEESYRMTNPS